MSIIELQGRIAAISADITRQKEVLTNLERSKSAALRALNALRDPVARLPLELSSEILIQCLPAREAPSVHHAPMLLLHVCNAWTDIALATPALWAAVHADVPKADLESLLDTWLKRAGSRPLSVSLPTEHSRVITALIEQHAHQLQDLTLHCDLDEDMDFAMHVSHLPVLKTLTLVGVEDFSGSITGTIDILRLCPALVECTLKNVSYPRNDTYDGTEALFLPHVQHFTFGIPSEGSGDYLLAQLTLPALQTLYIPLEKAKASDIVQFLRRSAPPLRAITMGNTWGFTRWTLREMEECISLLPKLTHFELIEPRYGWSDDFLTVLSDAPHVLPNLSMLTFRVKYPSGAWYHKLHGVLAVRRTQIRAVRIIWKHGILEGPSEEVGVNLRQLVAEGMNIHIGTEERNLI
ncbi:hypothetical protein FB451DRAFT_1391595 [Mycena latifolia]|nr:hypothetical protein FB451DRAFT_1391595 [Mycena latifolia]